MKSVPTELYLLHQWFVVEESLSLIRHDLRNRLGAIRNANFYVRRRVQKLAPDLAAADPRIPTFFELIATEADATEQIMQSRLPAPENAPAERIAASAIMCRIHDLVAFPANIRAIVETTSDAHLRIAPDEAALAVHCLVENAVDALADDEGTIRLRITTHDQDVVLEVEDDGAHQLPERALEPFFTTRTGRMGIGLNIARRVATRWNGTLSLAPASTNRGARAALTFKVEA